MSRSEADLVAAARAGDRAAFDALVGTALPVMRDVVRRMVGHPEDSEDVVQEAVLKAWTGMPGFRGDAGFATWARAIAARAAVDHLRGQMRWRKEAQVAYANSCAADGALSGEVMAVTMDPDFAFELRQHIAYCFTCVGRSLPPDEQAALVLRDVLGLSAREAAEALGVLDSVLRHRLSAARRAMTARYKGLCALINKQGICHQCTGLRHLAAEDRRGALAPDLGTLAQRCDVVRDAPAGRAMAALHDVFWRRTKEIGDAGAGEVRPMSGCGETEERHG